VITVPHDDKLQFVIQNGGARFHVRAENEKEVRVRL
jgi:hypothetical protein